MATKPDTTCEACKLGESLEDRVKAIEEAFPDGPLRHRDAHLAWMEAKRAEAEFWKALKKDLIMKGVWGLLVITVGLVLIGAATKLGLPIKQ